MMAVLLTLCLVNQAPTAAELDFDRLLGEFEPGEVDVRFYAAWYYDLRSGIPVSQASADSLERYYVGYFYNERNLLRFLDEYHDGKRVKRTVYAVNQLKERTVTYYNELIPTELLDYEYQTGRRIIRHYRVDYYSDFNKNRDLLSGRLTPAEAEVSDIFYRSIVYTGKREIEIATMDVYVPQAGSDRYMLAAAVDPDDTDVRLYAGWDYHEEVGDNPVYPSSMRVRPSPNAILTDFLTRQREGYTYYKTWDYHAQTGEPLAQFERRDDLPWYFRARWYQSPENIYRVEIWRNGELYETLDYRIPLRFEVEPYDGRSPQIEPCAEERPDDALPCFNVGLTVYRGVVWVTEAIRKDDSGREVEKTLYQLPDHPQLIDFYERRNNRLKSIFQSVDAAYDAAFGNQRVFYLERYFDSPDKHFRTEQVAYQDSEPRRVAGLDFMIEPEPYRLLFLRQYAVHGSPIRDWEPDEEGRVVNYTRYRYDSRGLLLEEEYWFWGTLIEQRTMHYDSMSRLVRENAYQQNMMTQYTIYHYNRRNLNTNRYTYRMPENRLVQQAISEYRSNGSLERETIYRGELPYLTFEYNSGEQLASAIIYDFEGDLDRRYHYDSDMTLTREDIFFDNEIVKYRIRIDVGEYEYYAFTGEQVSLEAYESGILEDQLSALLEEQGL